MDGAYSNADRAKVRQTVARAEQLVALLKQALKTGEAVPAKVADLAYRMTQSVDPNAQIVALTAFAEQVQSSHLERLEGLAHDDFSAFCEVMEPGEPPAGLWLEFLTDLLQRIEYDTVLENPRLAALAAEQGVARVRNLILNVPPGHAKPFWVETQITMGDGSQARLADVQVGDLVIARDGKPHRVSAVHEQGELPVVQITTKLGRRLTCAHDHPLLTVGGWRNAAELLPGDKLLSPLPDIDPKVNTNIGRLSAAMIRVVAFASIAASVARDKRGPYAPTLRLFTTVKPTLERVRNDIERLGLKMPVYRHAGSKGYLCNMDSRTRLAVCEVAPDIMSPQAQRRVPKAIFQSNRAKIAQFLRIVFDVKGESVRRLKSPNLQLHLSSEAYLIDIQALLARLGIAARLERPDAFCDGRSSLHLDANACRRYLDAVGDFEGYGAETLNAALDAAPDYSRTWDGADEVFTVEALHERRPCRCLTVEGEPSFVAEGISVHNSTYASRLFVAWRMGRNPDLKIVGSGHTQNFVEKEFSKKIRDMLLEPVYRRVFPGIAIDSSSRANDQWNIAGKRGQYVARGVGQAIHGFRFNFALIDDPYPSVTKAESPAYRREVETFVTKDIGTRMLPDAMTFVVMTRFHPEDITDTLVKLNESLAPNNRYLHIAIPAIAYSEDGDLLGRAYGERLWDFYGFDHFIEQRGKLKFRNYALIHLQRTEAVDEGSLASKFEYYEIAPHKTESAQTSQAERSVFYKRVVMSVDMAAKESQRADWTVAQVWATGRDGNHYLLDQLRFKAEFNEMVRKIERLGRKWDVEQMLVEDKGQGTAYIQARGKTRFQHRLAPAPIIPIDPGQQSKSFRLDEVSPMIEEGVVLLPEHARWLPEFVTEVGQMSTEGGPAHDDQVDAMTQYLKWAKSQKRTYGSKKAKSFG